MRKQKALDAGTSARVQVQGGESISIVGNAGCSLHIVGSPGSLQLRGFSGRSRVVVQGAVTSSAFVENCRETTLFIASGQFRSVPYCACVSAFVSPTAMRCKAAVG